MAKSKSKAEEALQFLDDLDNLSPAPPASGGSAASTNSSNPNDPTDVLKFIDEITQKSSEPRRLTPSPLERPASRASIVTPNGTIRKATERVRVGTPTPGSAGSIASIAAQKSESSQSGSSPAQTETSAKDADAEASGKGGWGWGSVWTSASAVIQQARSAVDEGVKHLPNPEQALKWREEVIGYVPRNKEQLEKFGNDLRTVGYSTLTDILNAVAPPISEHEVIQVWSSHDMDGPGQIMEQVEGGDLTVNKGQKLKAREKAAQRNLNAVEGMETALRLAEANIEELIKSIPKKEQTPAASSQIPTTYSSVYLRIQPFFTSLPTLGNWYSSETSGNTHLQFILYLADPDHQLTHLTVTQVMPAKWMEQWDTQDWVEDVVVEALRTGVETIGQEYIVARMGWIKDDAEAPETQETEEPEEPK
ncbi:hypothetical protein EW145_g408 [Phellinidium pouzarii]|uniref:Maintenance of telomere capping protein 1 n=1 Tax=Phellinidium pouzarii TaxID=167371 RepID=A0A4S4LJ25_9AGAM|nr:hypothetical protein EW145_g408 [Phellinidium pouzarii]